MGPDRVHRKSTCANGGGAAGLYGDQEEAWWPEGHGRAGAWLGQVCRCRRASPCGPRLRVLGEPLFLAGSFHCPEDKPSFTRKARVPGSPEDGLEGRALAPSLGCSPALLSGSPWASPSQGRRADLARLSLFLLFAAMKAEGYYLRRWRQAQSHAELVLTPGSRGLPGDGLCGGHRSSW